MDLESFVHGSGKWFCTSLYRRPPANGFRVFCSWHWKWCKWYHRPIVDRSAPRAVSCCQKLNEIVASSSRTKGKHWNSLKILNNLFESERDVPASMRSPNFRRAFDSLTLTVLYVSVWCQNLFEYLALQSERKLARRIRKAPSKEKNKTIKHDKKQ